MTLTTVEDPVTDGEVNYVAIEDIPAREVIGRCCRERGRGGVMAKLDQDMAFLSQSCFSVGRAVLCGGRRGGGGMIVDRNMLKHL